MAYDRLDRLIEVKDTAGNRWWAAYDRLGRRTTVSDPNYGTWTFAHDARDKVVQQVDANSATTTFKYDAMARETGREHRTSASTLTSWHEQKYDEIRSGYYNGGKLSSSRSFSSAARTMPHADTDFLTMTPMAAKSGRAGR